MTPPQEPDFPDDVFHYIVFEDADGIPWSEGGAVIPVIGPQDGPQSPPPAGGPDQSSENR